MHHAPALAVAALSLLTPTSIAAPPQEGAQPSLEEVNRIGREIGARVDEAGGNILARMETLRALADEYADDAFGRQVVALYAMQKAAELGNYAEALRFADASPSFALPLADEVHARLASAEARDAVEAIAELAEDELLVMINEAHHVPQHRALTIELLHALRAQGFTHFAAETLSEEDTGLSERGYPTKATGPYVDEPLYGDLVRTALALGFVVVPYEAFGAGDRELGQATNLLARTLEADEDARVVVHAGYAHVNEVGDVASSRAMAGRVKEITGIDPLTIDQTVMSEHAERRFEHPSYRPTVEARGIERAVVLVNGDAPWSAEPGVRDVTVFHPPSVLEDGRPTWLRMNGLRRALLLDDATRAAWEDEPLVVVEARYADEPREAVPVDRIELRGDDATPRALLLPAGRFSIEVRSVDDALLRTIEVELD